MLLLLFSTNLPRIDASYPAIYLIYKCIKFLSWQIKYDWLIDANTSITCRCESIVHIELETLMQCGPERCSVGLATSDRRRAVFRLLMPAQSRTPDTIRSASARSPVCGARRRQPPFPVPRCSAVACGAGGDCGSAAGALIHAADRRPRLRQTNGATHVARAGAWTRRRIRLRLQLPFDCYSTAVWFPFDCSSTALRPYDARPGCCTAALINKIGQRDCG